MELPPPGSAVSAGSLADAFSEFIETSRRLESSYRALQREVQMLNGELAERNAELSATLAENLRMQRERDAARNAMALAQVSTILAHEMRNPLASMELFADLIENDSERRAEWTANLRAGIRTLSGTVNNVLSFHEHPQKATMKLAPLRLADVVEHALRFMQPVAEQSGVELRWAGSAACRQILGNEYALRQVLLNLTANALRHTPAGGAITYTTSLGTAGQTQLLCADTGPGIREQDIGRIFEPGFSGTGDSVGLGLAVCERIMHRHHGSICAANMPAGGACFTLTFPAYCAAQEAA